MPRILRAMLCGHSQGRMADTNANLVGRALVVSAQLARAMGSPWDRTARDMLKTAVECLADKKKPVRSVASFPDLVKLTPYGGFSEDKGKSSHDPFLMWQVRDGVVTLMDAWVAVSSPERVIPVLADYLSGSKGSGA